MSVQFCTTGLFHRTESYQRRLSPFVRLRESAGPRCPGTLSLICEKGRGIERSTSARHATQDTKELSAHRVAFEGEISAVDSRRAARKRAARCSEHGAATLQGRPSKEQQRSGAARDLDRHRRGPADPGHRCSYPPAEENSVHRRTGVLRFQLKLPSTDARRRWLERVR